MRCATEIQIQELHIKPDLTVVKQMHFRKENVYLMVTGIPTPETFPRGPPGGHCRGHVRELGGPRGPSRGKGSLQRPRQPLGPQHSLLFSAKSIRQILLSLNMIFWQKEHGLLDGKHFCGSPWGRDLPSPSSGCLPTGRTQASCPGLGTAGGQSLRDW